MNERHIVRRRTDSPDADAMKTLAYKQLINKKREELWEKGVQPIIDKVRNMNQMEFEMFKLELIADWHVNPHFMNSAGSLEPLRERGWTCPDGCSIETEDSKVITKRHNPNETDSLNLMFIERFSGKKFASLEEAQKFMLADAYNRPRPYHKGTSDTPTMAESEIDEIRNSMRWSATCGEVIDG